MAHTGTIGAGRSPTEIYEEEIKSETVIKVCVNFKVNIR